MEEELTALRKDFMVSTASNPLLVFFKEHRHMKERSKQTSSASNAFVATDDIDDVDDARSVYETAVMTGDLIVSSYLKMVLVGNKKTTCLD